MTRADSATSSPRLFESELLERLTHVHPVVPVVVFAPAIAALAGVGLARLATALVLALAIAGFAFWTLTEYWLHRAVFHLEPAGATGARLHRLVHGVHHDQPNDPSRLVMPPTASVPLALAFFGVFALVLGPTAALPFTAGFLAGYLRYDMAHYRLHRGRHRTRWGRRLREQHMRHHFQDETRGFGVSVPWWDHVFGTAPRRSG